MQLTAIFYLKIFQQIQRGINSCEINRHTFEDIDTCHSHFKQFQLAGGLLTGKHKIDDHPEEETKLGRFFGNELWPSK